MENVKQLVKASKKMRRNGFYKVYGDFGTLKGWVEKPYHINKEYRAYFDLEPDNAQTFSTLKAAVKFILKSK